MPTDEARHPAGASRTGSPRFVPPLKRNSAVLGHDEVGAGRRGIGRGADHQPGLSPRGASRSTGRAPRSSRRPCASDRRCGNDPRPPGRPRRSLRGRTSRGNKTRSLSRPDCRSPSNTKGPATPRVAVARRASVPAVPARGLAASRVPARERGRGGPASWGCFRSETRPGSRTNSGR